MNEDNDSDQNRPNRTSLDSERKSWIRFEEPTEENQNEVHIEIPTEANRHSDCATIEPTDSIQINTECLKRSVSSPLSSLANVLPTNQTTNANIMSNVESNKVVDKKFLTNNNTNSYHQNGETSTTSSMQTVPLKDANGQTAQCNHSSCQQRNGFSNGDVIVTVLPTNNHCSWLTPSIFKPELVPEELMEQSLSLTVEDYVSAIQVLVNDLRFNLYISLYKRILVIWIALGFAVLLGLLFSGIKGLPLFVGGVIWLIINVFGIFISMFCKVKLYHMLERCISQVNSMLYKHNILLGVDDRGHISCHKINLVFVYFDVKYCIEFLKHMIENESQSSNTTSSVSPSTNPSNTAIISRMDINTSDVMITGSQPKSVSQSEKIPEKLLLRYSQRWVKDYIRRKIDLNMPLHADAAGVSVAPLPSTPRHCPVSRCLCQFIEEHLKYKPLTQCSLSELFM